jgi:hypothetical protein
VKFDESNSSQREQVSENLVDDEEPPSVSIFKTGKGEVMPREVQVQALVDTNNQDPSSSTRVGPSSSQANQDESLVHGDDHGRGFDQGGEKDDEAQDEAPQEHPVDNILGSITQG